MTYQINEYENSNYLLQSSYGFFLINIIVFCMEFLDTYRIYPTFEYSFICFPNYGNIFKHGLDNKGMVD
jgi:hypothetical protein